MSETVVRPTLASNSTLTPRLATIACACALACTADERAAMPVDTLAVATDDATRDTEPHATVDAPPPTPSAIAPVEMIGLIMVELGGDPNAPTAPWGRDDLFTAVGAANHAMFDESIDDATGTGGLRLSGVGLGAGIAEKPARR